jgi:hypothetical protein
MTREGNMEVFETLKTICAVGTIALINFGLVVASSRQKFAPKDLFWQAHAYLVWFSPRAPQLEAASEGWYNSYGPLTVNGHTPKQIALQLLLESVFSAGVILVLSATLFLVFWAWLLNLPVDL